MGGSLHGVWTPFFLRRAMRSAVHAQRACTCCQLGYTTSVAESSPCRSSSQRIATRRKNTGVDGSFAARKHDSEGM
jgi:hypothetical protein